MSPADDELERLFGSLAGKSSPAGTVSILISETIRFRDHLKERTGETLTVGDTRGALDELQDRLNGLLPSGKLTPNQERLVQLWLERLAGSRR